MNSRIAWLIMILILLNVLDLTTTYYALSVGAVEANPIMARGFDRGHAVIYKIVGLAVAIGLTVRRVRRNPNMIRTYAYIYTAFCVLYFLVLVNNAVVILYLRGLSY